MHDSIIMVSNKPVQMLFLILCLEGQSRLQKPSKGQYSMTPPCLFMMNLIMLQHALLDFEIP